MLAKSRKSAMTIFKLLTFNNLKASMNQGCLLLALTVDCEIDEKGALSMIF